MQLADLTGRWQLISATMKIGEQVHDNFNKDRRMIKEFSGNKFYMFSHLAERDSLSAEPSESDKAQAFDGFAAGMGSVSCVDGHYVEEVEFCSYANYEGKRFEFELSLQDGVLVQRGHYPLIELGFGDQDGFVEERYRKVD